MSDIGQEGFGDGQQGADQDDEQQQSAIDEHRGEGDDDDTSEEGSGEGYTQARATMLHGSSHLVCKCTTSSSSQ